MESALAELITSSKLIPLVAITGGCLVAFFAVVSGAISTAVRTNARERTRREIAAYIAEGSMTPEIGERLINAGKPPQREGGGWGCCG